MKSRISIITDSNSGITEKQAEKLGVKIIPMPFTIGDKEYYENVNLTGKEFFEFLDKGYKVSTSQPSLSVLYNTFKDALDNSEEVVYIPMSSSLSGSADTAKWLSKDEFEGKVTVVDNKRISSTQKQSVYDALEMARHGYSAKDIKDALENNRMNTGIYITVDTLEYLKKGGRITPTAATIATVLGIKPVLQIQGGKIDSYGKARGITTAKREVLKAAQKDIEKRFYNKKIVIKGAYSGDKKQGEEWKKEMEEFFHVEDIETDPLSLSICCHVGKGAYGVAVIEKGDL